MAYKSIVRPSMEYACEVWIPHTEKDCALLDAIQNWAARWILKSWWDPKSLRWTKSSRDCVLTVNWPFLSTRQMYFIIMFLLMFTMDSFHLLSNLTFCHNLETQEVTSLHFRWFLPPLILIVIHWWWMEFFVEQASPFHSWFGNSTSAFKLALRKWLFL